MSNNQPTQEQKESDCWMVLKNGKPLLMDGRLPIYWLKQVAENHAKRFSMTTVVKVKCTWHINLQNQTT